MLTKITTPAETAIAAIVSKYPTISKNITDNYSNLSNTLNNNYSNLSNKFNETYPSLSSTLSNGTNYVRSLPLSIGSTVGSYASMFPPVDADEREVARTPANDNLGENVIALNEERQEILNHILDIYSCKPSKECFKHYADDVVLEDPLIYSIGLASLKAHFYGMPKLFAKSTTESYKILENTAFVLRFDITQKYTLPLVGRAFVQNCQIVLELEENKIVKHTDLWSGKQFNRDGILMVRKGISKLVSYLVSVPEN